MIAPVLLQVDDHLVPGVGQLGRGQTARRLLHCSCSVEVRVIRVLAKVFGSLLCLAELGQ